MSSQRTTHSSTLTSYFQTFGYYPGEFKSNNRFGQLDDDQSHSLTSDQDDDSFKPFTIGPETLIWFSSSENKVDWTYEVSKTLEPRHIPTKDLMVITCCMVKRENPTVPIPMSVNQNVYITFFISNFNTSSDKECDMSYFINLIQTVFEREHQCVGMGSYYHDVEDQLIKSDQTKTFYNKQYGQYAFYDESGEFVLLFGINYTPVRICLFEFNTENIRICHKARFVW